VLNKAYIDLKALASYLDPALGHNREPPRNVKRGEKIERKTRRAPTEVFLSLPFSLHTNLTPYFDPKPLPLPPVMVFPNVATARNGISLC
jgi:hypothetical protein